MNATAVVIGYSHQHQSVIVKLTEAHLHDRAIPYSSLYANYTTARIQVMTGSL